MTTPGPETNIPIGVYRGAAADITAIQAYEQFLNMPSGVTVNYVLSYTADTPSSWAQFEQAIMPTHTNGPPGTVSATAWAPILGGRTLVLGVPACCMGTTWADESSGVNDAHWKALTATLINAGLGSCLLRIAREFNTGYAWKATPSNASAYMSGYARIVNTMRAAGFTGKFMWNSMIGQGNFGPNAGVESVYPGDSVVDIIGLDMYDGWVYPAGEEIRTVAQQQTAWNSYRDQWDGLTGWRALAASHGKPLCYPEWGLQLWNVGGKYVGGGDNSLFITEMAAWFKDSGTYFHALWEDTGMGVMDPDDSPWRNIAVPNSREAFLYSFGY